MHSFKSGFLAQKRIPHALLKSIRLLGEYKGKEALFAQQSPQILETLRQASVIQSTESSNRIEGVEAPPERIKSLVQHKSTPQNRSEQEIAGYRDALAGIHAHAEGIRLTPSIVLRFHQDLYRFSTYPGGAWKSTDNEITERYPDGSLRTRFKPVPARATVEAMETLHTRFEQEWQRGEIDPLLLIPTYVLDFLCIHPFMDGNGRMARLLSLLLLYHAGYGIGRYISLEQLIESQREGYYDALYKSSQGWHDGAHDPLPWWEYFLGVMLLEAYREFERRTGELRWSHGAKSEMVMAAIARLPESFRYGDVAHACPQVSRPTIRRVLTLMREGGRLECLGPGRDAVWRKRD